MTDPITRDELRAAVEAGAIPASQAEALARFVDRRRAASRAGDEPLPLFRGVNDLLMALGTLVGGIGMVLLVAALPEGGLKALLAAALLVPVAVFSRVFARRRAELPGILAAVGGSLLLGIALIEAAALTPLAPADMTMDRFTDRAGLAAAGIATLLWGLAARAALRTAFPLAMAAAGLAAAPILTLATIAGWPDAPELLGASRPVFAAIALAAGFGAASAGLRRDFADPLRASYRATEAFWLHAAAATLFGAAISLGVLHGLGEAKGVPIAAALGLPLALYALIIDRRSFLTLAAAWVGWYAVRLARGVDLGSDAAMAAAATLSIGLALLGLALGWSRVRRALMRALPDFPGKDRLPPWDAASAARN